MKSLLHISLPFLGSQLFETGTEAIVVKTQHRYSQPECLGSNLKQLKEAECLVNGYLTFSRSQS